MRCNICDERLEPQEIKLNPVTDKFEPCNTCLTISKATLKGYDLNEEEQLSDEDISEYLRTE